MVKNFFIQAIESDQNVIPMSQHTFGGREGRPNATSSRSGGSVTVKTLPNSQSLSSSSSSSHHHQNKRIYTKDKLVDKDNSTKSSKDQSFAPNRHKNGDVDIVQQQKPKILAPRNSKAQSNGGSTATSSSASIGSGSTNESSSIGSKSVSSGSSSSNSASSQPAPPRLVTSSKGRNQERAGAVLTSLQVGDRKSSLSVDREVEVRSSNSGSSHMGREMARGGKSSSSARSRNQYGTSSSYSSSSRGSGRIFTSEKYRNSNNHHVMENDMAGRLMC